MEEVEKFSERVYTKLKEEHGVDDTFDERVCDQTDISTEITRRAKPVPIPYRYRVRSSLQKYLYKIEMGDIGGPAVFDKSPPELRLSSSGHRLAIAMLIPGDLTRIFDFSTKRLTTLEHNSACSIDSILLDDNRVITWSHDGIIKIWTEDSESGQWNHETLAQFDNLIEDKGPGPLSVCHEGEIFTIGFNHTTSLCESIAISVEDGSVNVQLEIDNLIVNTAFVARDGNQKWHVINGHVYENGVSNYCLFIYNMNSPEKRQRLFGRGQGIRTLEYCKSLVQASDCSKTFFAFGHTNTNQQLVVMLDPGEDGLIAERFSFPVLGSCPRIVAASKTKVLVANNNMVDLYDVAATTTRPMRSYGPFTVSIEGGIPGAIHSTRNEFLTVNHQGGLFAFCLEEPHL